MECVLPPWLRLAPLPQRLGVLYGACGGGLVLLLFVARGVGPLVKTTRAQESRSRRAVEEAPAQKQTDDRLSPRVAPLLLGRLRRARRFQLSIICKQKARDPAFTLTLILPT